MSNKKNPAVARQRRLRNQQKRQRRFNAEEKREKPSSFSFTDTYKPFGYY